VPWSRHEAGGTAPNQSRLDPRPRYTLKPEIPISWRDERKCHRQCSAWKHTYTADNSTFIYTPRTKQLTFRKGRVASLKTLPWSCSKPCARLVRKGCLGTRNNVLRFSVPSGEKKQVSSVDCTTQHDGTIHCLSIGRELAAYNLVPTRCAATVLGKMSCRQGRVQRAQITRSTLCSIWDVEADSTAVCCFRGAASLSCTVVGWVPKTRRRRRSGSTRDSTCLWQRGDKGLFSKPHPANTTATT